MIEDSNDDIKQTLSKLLSQYWKQFWAQQRQNKITKICAECGNEFEVTQIKQDVAKYCSARCRARAFRKRRKQENQEHHTETRDDANQN